jgi:signal peptide peptidase-like protein 2B
LYGSATNDEEAVTIPAAYLTLQQGHALLQQMETHAHVGVTLSARWRPHYNISSMLIWAMGVAAATLASYLSAADYRAFMDQTLRRRVAPASAAGATPRTTAPSPIQEELTVWHALSFIVMASSSLLILFYFQIYSFVKIMYALGCSKAVSSILLDPLLKVVMTKCGVSNKVVWRTDTEDFGDITTRDMWAHILGYSLGLAWIIVAFVVRHPDNVTFFWVTQDVFGVCKSDHDPRRSLARMQSSLTFFFLSFSFLQACACSFSRSLK